MTNNKHARTHLHTIWKVFRRDLWHKDFAVIVPPISTKNVQVDSAGNKLCLAAHHEAKSLCQLPSVQVPNIHFMHWATKPTKENNWTEKTTRNYKKQNINAELEGRVGSETK